MQRNPRLVPALSGKGLRQISAASKHAAASDTSLPVKGGNDLRIPDQVPSKYYALKEAPCEAILARLMLLRHFSSVICKSWTLFTSVGKSKVIVVLVALINLVGFGDGA